MLKIADVQYRPDRTTLIAVEGDTVAETADLSACRKLAVAQADVLLGASAIVSSETRFVVDGQPVSGKISFTDMHRGVRQQVFIFGSR